MKKNDVRWVMFLAIILCSVNAPAESGYDSLKERDPFVPLVGINLQDSLTNGSGEITAENIKLQGIVINPDGTYSALINGEVVREQTVFGTGVFVEEIRDNTVTLVIQEKRYVLRLYEESLR